MPMMKARATKKEKELRCWVLEKEPSIPPPRAAPAVFTILELLENILQHLDLRTLHVIRRVNSTFKGIIETSPTIRPLALGHNDPEASEILRHIFFRICPQGSSVFITHAIGGSLFGMTLGVSALTLGQTERLHGLWEDIVLHARSGHLQCWFRHTSNFANRKVWVECGITFGGLIDLVLEEIKKGGESDCGYVKE